MSKKLDLFNVNAISQVTYNMGPFHSEDRYELVKTQDDDMWRMTATEEVYNRDICVGQFPSREAFEKNFDDIYAITDAIRKSECNDNTSEIAKIIFRGDGDYSVKVSSSDFLEIPEVNAKFTTTCEHKVDVNDINKLRKDLEQFSQFRVADNVEYVLMDGKDIWEGAGFIPLTQETLSEAQVLTGVKTIVEKMEELNLESEFTIQAIPYEQLKLEKSFLPCENSFKI